MIYIGTSGYSYQDWIGPFYPQGTKSGDMLSCYAEHFSFTEINSTYYKIPNPFMLYNMQKKTGDNFVFTVKLHQSMTHGKNASKQDYKSFIEAASVLEQTGKLGCLVAQFPYSFYCNQENKDYILNVREQLMDFKLVVEFRNNKWLNDETFEFLRDSGMGYVCVDEPALAGLLDKRSIAVSDTAYIRFHGRNSQKWWNHNEAYERYDYLYNESELLEWKNKIKSLERESRDIFVSFNNHFRAQAVVNARMLRAMLD
jgi:uncharacterized protein YecE (DUF72 family)